MKPEDAVEKRDSDLGDFAPPEGEIVQPADDQSEADDEIFIDKDADPEEAIDLDPDPTLF